MDWLQACDRELHLHEESQQQFLRDSTSAGELVPQVSLSTVYTRPKPFALHWLLGMERHAFLTGSLMSILTISNSLPVPDLTATAVWSYAFTDQCSIFRGLVGSLLQQLLEVLVSKRSVAVGEGLWISV